MKTNISLVVFDIAGTTVRDDSAIGLCFQKAMAAFGFNLPLARISQLMGYEKSEAIKIMLLEIAKDAAVVNAPRITQIHTRFISEMVTYYQTVAHIDALPGVAETFAGLRRSGIKIALNTGFSKMITDVILKRLAWVPQKVDYVVSSSEVARGRPYPFMIHDLMAQAGIADAQDVVKVGDTEVDIREGQNAGCRFSIGVTTGAFTRAELLPYHPSHIIDDMRELLPILANMHQPA